MNAYHIEDILGNKRECHTSLQECIKGVERQKETVYSCSIRSQGAKQVAQHVTLRWVI